MNFGLDPKKMTELREKITQSEKFDFTKEEKELMFKMAGFDLLNNTELKCIAILFLAEEIE